MSVLVIAEHLEPGLIAPGYAETILARAREIDDPELLWDGATGFEALAKKRQGYAVEQIELRRAALYCEVLLAQVLGPPPGAGPGRGIKESHGMVFIPQPVVSKLRTLHGHQDDLLALIRATDTGLSRSKLLRHVAQQARTVEIVAARAARTAVAVAPDEDEYDEDGYEGSDEHDVHMLVADAREMPIEDDVIDLTVTSPPYALEVAYIDGDVAEHAWAQFMFDWLVEDYRVTRPSGRLALNVPLDTTLGGPRPTYAIAVWAALEAGWKYRSSVVWLEGNTTKGNRALGSVNSAARPHVVDSSEMVAFFSKGDWGPSSDGPDTILPDEWQTYGRGPWQFPGESRAWEGHPAPFPLELPRRCIRLLSRAGDLILDPFAGSGTTVLASIQEGRRAIALDVSAEYIEGIHRRLHDA